MTASRPQGYTNYKTQMNQMSFTNNTQSINSQQSVANNQTSSIKFGPTFPAFSSDFNEDLTLY